MSKYSEWIAANSNAAINATKGTAIFPEILLSQAIIESAKGGKMPGTQLAKQYNNYFGIKAGKKWTGKTATFDTGEVDQAGNKYIETAARFRAYATPGDSFKDYVKFLQVNPRYKKVFTATTPEAQARELQRAGYSTNPNYSEIISSMANVIKKALGATTHLVAENKGKTAIVLLTVAAATYYLTNGRK